MGVVQRVLDKIANEHFDTCWQFRVPFKVIRRDAHVCRVFGIGCLIEEYLSVIVETVFFFLGFPSSGRERSGCEVPGESMKRGYRWVGRQAAALNRYSRDERPQMAHEPCNDGWLAGDEGVTSRERDAHFGKIISRNFLPWSSAAS